ncbi:PREDICTED: leucine-rich repeat-containing protein 56 [Chrysochloris asiatica]|uniref:Leucine-rich repeat-containing protein 56 n=1 Tax=Chrysochloris asiatica TaxID=185453 RepID=A0A9B0U4V1_CHRAS|nr:PREDICTED: leucine-rich repeat-containing protein 56 [Chrysochloris asiatica]
MEPAQVRAQGPQPSLGSFRVQELSWPGLHNPCPQSKGSGSRGAGHRERPMEEYLSPSRLQALAQVDDLRVVSVLEMCVDSHKNSLGNFGVHLPNLSQLKLNGSRLASLRDLGTSLGHLQVLWLARCGLSDLDGIGSFPALKELYVAYNNISDLSPLCLLEQLEVLDLEGNSVEDLGQVRYLQLCPRLSTLTLEGNLVCLRPGPGLSNKAPRGYNYRTEVRRLIPQLQVLDEAPAAQTGLLAARTLTQDWLMVKEAIREGGVLDSLLPGPGTGHGAPMKSLPEAQPRVPSLWPLSLLLPEDHLPEGLFPKDGTPEDDASNLTHGTSHVLCGNPTKGLRERRHKSQAWASREQLTRHRPENLLTSASAPGSDPAAGSDHLALAKLQTWRELCPCPLPCRHLKSRKEGTAASQGPQRCSKGEKNEAGPQAAPGHPSLAPECSGASGCKLIPSPPKCPMPPDSGTSSWGSTEQPFRGRRLRGLGQGLAAVTALRALDITSGQSPRAHRHPTPQPALDVATRLPGLRCMQSLDPIPPVQSHP